MIFERGLFGKGSVEIGMSLAQPGIVLELESAPAAVEGANSHQVNINSGAIKILVMLETPPPEVRRLMVDIVPPPSPIRGRSIP
jgi:hypothetical protein